MTDAIITYVRVSCGMNDDAQGLEIVSFSFSKFRKEYFVQNAQGGNGGTITASFDIRANTEV
jgi:type VI secretion system secreted protein Hcp